MPDGLNTQARVEFEVISNLRKAVGDVEEYISTTEKVPGALKKAADAARSAIDSIDGTGNAAAGASKKVAKYAEGFQELVDQLNKFKKAQREAAQTDVVGGSLDGKGRAALESLSTSELKAYIAVDDARAQNAVSVARQIVAARESADSQTIASREREDHIYNDLLSRQRAHEDQAVKESLAAIERVSAARTAAYTQAFQQAQSIDSGIASDQLARRNAVPVAATRNSASPIAMRTAQEDYSAQETRDFSNALKANAEAHNQVYNAAHAEALAMNEARDAAKTHTASIISARYALYDVATSAGIAATALLGVATATAVMAANYETAFTAVERTTMATGASLDSIRGQLLGLARDIPVAFADVTSIASLGAQLGIADSDLAGFTETVAKFSAATDVTAETAAQSFGALGTLLNVSAADYERLGSSIAFVGVNSVATESEILAMATRIGASAANAGIAAEHVIALSGALASLRVAPERAQGVLQVYFKVLNNAIADGGKRLDAFATVAGTTADNVGQLVKTDPIGFFRKLSAGLGSLDSISQTRALDDLGLSGIRAGEVFTRVANNLPVFDQAMSDANQSYKDGTFLADAYAIKVDDIASRFQILLNSLSEFAATAGSALTPVIGPMIDQIAGIVQWFTDMVKTPAGQWLSQVALEMGAVTGAAFALIAAAALAGATLFALRTAVTGLGLGAATTGLGGFIAGLVGVSTASGGAATALGIFKTALLATGIGAAIVLLGALAVAFTQASQDSTAAFANFAGSTAGLAEAIAADTDAYNALGSESAKAASNFTPLTLATQDNKDAFDDNARAVANAAAILGVEAPGSIDKATGAIRDNSAALGDNTIAWLKNQFLQSDAFKRVSKNEGFAKFFTESGANFDEVIRIAALKGRKGLEEYFLTLERTFRGGRKRMAKLFGEGANLGVVDVINGMSGLQGTVSILGLQNAINGAGAAAEKGTEENEEYKGSLDDLGGSAKETVRTLVDYANDLSGVFGRAFDIRFGGGQALDTITSGWAKIRDAASEAAKAMADANATLSQLAADRAINEYWLSVANAYGDTLRASKIQADLAKNAEDTADAQKDLSKAQSKSNKTLVGNSDAAIDNRAEILGLVGNYQSYITALASSGLSQSELATKTAQLKADFMNQATQLGYNRQELGTYASAFDDVSLAIGRVPRNITVTANTNPALQALNEFEAKARSMAANSYGGGTIKAPVVEKPAYIVDPSDVTKYQQARDRGYIDAEQFHKYVYGFRDGGYTGGGGTSDVAGVVHGKEFVFSAPAVKNIGVGNLAYAHQMAKRGRRGFESGGFAGGSGVGFGIMELGPKSLGAIREIARSETYAILASSDAELAQHVKRGQEALSFSGGN